MPVAYNRDKVSFPFYTSSQGLCDPIVWQKTTKNLALSAMVQVEGQCGNSRQVAEKSVCESLMLFGALFITRERGITAPDVVMVIKRYY